MKYSKSAAAFAALAFLLTAFTIRTIAQNDSSAVSEQNYEVFLQVLAEPDDKGGKTDLPENLTTVQKEIKSTFGIQKLRLMNTFIARINSNGTISYKGILNSFGSDNTRPSFLDWAVENFRVNASGPVSSGVSMQSFRFGARVPVATNIVSSEEDKPIMQVTWESVGLNLQQLGFHLNQPTLIGTLELPGSNGMLFLVLTVKPV